MRGLKRADIQSPEQWKLAKIVTLNKLQVAQRDRCQPSTENIFSSRIGI